MPVKYNITSARDASQQNQNRFDNKLDRHQPVRATIVDELGNDSGSGEIWADRNARRVWIRELGTSSASQVYCYSLTPVIGLGVMVGWPPYSNVRQVLSSDIEFLGPTNPDGTSYESPSNLDFLPGGRLQLWLQSKLIQPLVTSPASSGLVVKVIGGDYPYQGKRKTFAGQTNIDLSSAQPSAGQYRFVGLYLDADNTLQTVNGAAGASTPPAEPAWPTGAFRLSVVRLYNPQTSIALSLDTDSTNDIFDRRMVWSDVMSSWPYDKILTVSPTGAMFTTIQAAINYQEANSLQDVIILCDAAVYTETLTFTLGSVCLCSLGVNGEVVVTSTDAITITINAPNVTLRNIMIDNDETGTNGTCVQVAANRDGTIFDNCRFNVTNATVTNAYGADINGGDQTGTLFRECTFFLDAGSSTNVAIDVAADCIILVEDGQIEALGGTNYAINSASGSIIRLNNPRIISGSINGAGTLVSENPIVAQVNGAYTLGNSLNGKNWNESLFKTTANNSTVVTTSGSGRILRNWLIQNAGAGTTEKCLVNSQLLFRADGCYFLIGSNPTNGVGFHSTGGDSYLKGCRFDVAGSSTNRAILADTAASTVVVEGGYIANGDVVTNHAGAVIELRGPQFGSTVAITQTLGVIRGHYYDSNGKLIVVGTTDILGKASNVPDLGSTTAAEKWGNIYQASLKDIFPAGDDFGFWSRYVNYGRTPDEHWRGGADEISWTGWASYTSFATPGSVAYPTSRLQVQHTAATRAFRYRSFINAQTAIEARCMPDISSETGIMVDDGVNNADGVGANNFYRVFLERASGTSNVNFCIEHRAGGAAVTKVTAYTFPAGTFRGTRLLYGVGTRWTNWQCFAYIITENGQSNAAHILSSLTWTPARHGLFHRQTIANVFSVWDWFEEA